MNTNNTPYIGRMTLEDEYIYTLIHLVEHFKRGGVGIRFLMDIYVYRHLKGINMDSIRQELVKLDLWEFYQNILYLAERWFGNDEQKTEVNAYVIDALEEYIIQNGTFGSKENAAALSVEKYGKFGFLWGVLFPSLKEMQTMYSWLKRYPILQPIAWGMRGVRSFMYRRQNIHAQVDVYRNGNIETGKRLRDFYDSCGL